MSARLIVLDLDGTLIDSTRDLAEAVNRTLARLAPGTSPLSLAAVRGFVGDGARNLVERSLRTAGLATAVDDALSRFLEEYRGCLLDNTRLYPGVAEALDLLSDRLLAVLSNKPGDMSRAILDGLGVTSRFARVYGGGDVPGRKPDPAGLLRLMGEFGVSCAQTVMVGDSPIDVRTGRAAGVRTAGVTYGFDPAGFSEVPPDLLVNDLRELPGLL